MLDRLIRFSYPYPIAATYQNIQSIVYPEEMPHKYNRIIDLYDSILKVVTYYLLGHAFNERILNTKTRRQLETTLKNPIPSNWTQLMDRLLENLNRSKEPLIQEIAQFYHGSDKNVPRIRNAVYYMLDKLTPAHDVKEMNVARFFDAYNRYISETDMVGFNYAAAIDILLPAFEEVLIRLEFLKDYAMVFVSNIQIEGKRFDHSLDVMSGIAPSRKRYISDTPIKERNRKMYVFRETSEGLEPMFCLHPFIVEHTCGIHNKGEIYFLRYKQSEELDYYCFQCRERFRPERYLSDYTEVLDENVAALSTEITDEVIELYREVLNVAWRDGVLTKEERNKLDFLRDHFKISESLARNMEESVKQQLGLTGVELDIKVIREYENLVQNAIIKGTVTPNMRAFIERIRTELSVPAHYARKLESRIWYDEGVKFERLGSTDLARTCYFNAQVLDETNLAAVQKSSEFAPVERPMSIELSVTDHKVEPSQRVIRPARAEAIYPQEDQFPNIPQPYEERDGHDTVVLKIPKERKIKEPMVKVVDTPVAEDAGYRPKSKSKSKVIKSAKIQLPSDEENQAIYDEHMVPVEEERPEEYAEAPYVEEQVEYAEQYAEEAVEETEAGYTEHQVEYSDEDPSEYAVTMPVAPEEREKYNQYFDDTYEVEHQQEQKDGEEQFDTEVEGIATVPADEEEVKPEETSIAPQETPAPEAAIEETAGAEQAEEGESEILDDQIRNELTRDVSPEEIKELIGEDYELTEFNAEKAAEGEQSAGTAVEEETEEQAAESKVEEDGGPETEGEEESSLEEAEKEEAETEEPVEPAVEEPESKEIPEEELEEEPEEDSGEEESSLEEAEGEEEILADEPVAETESEEKVEEKTGDADDFDIEVPEANFDTMEMDIVEPDESEEGEEAGEASKEEVPAATELLRPETVPVAAEEPAKAEKAQKREFGRKISKVEKPAGEEKPAVEEKPAKAEKGEGLNIAAQLNKAKQMLQAEKFDEARELLDEVLKTDNSNLAARLLRGRCAIEEEDYEQAFSDLTEVLKVKGDDVILLMLHGKASLEVGELETALSDLDKVITAKPQNVDAYFLRGSVYLDLGDFEKAIADFDRVILEKPEEVDSYINRGSCYLELKEYEQALEDFKKAETIDSEDSDTVFKQGLLYGRLNNFEQALHLFDRAIELEEEEMDYHLHRSDTLFKMGRLEEALEELDIIIEEDRNSPSAYLLQGKVYEQLGNDTKAIEAYTRLSKIRGEKAEGLAQRGRVFASLGDFKTSMEDFDRAIDTDPENLNARLFKGNALLEMEQFQEAIDIYSGLIEVDQSIAEAFLHRGIAHEKMGNQEMAQQDFDNYLHVNRLEKV